MATQLAITLTPGYNQVTRGYNSALQGRGSKAEREALEARFNTESDTAQELIDQITSEAGAEYQGSGHYELPSLESLISIMRAVGAFNTKSEYMIIIDTEVYGDL